MSVKDVAACVTMVANASPPLFRRSSYEVAPVDGDHVTETELALIAVAEKFDGIGGGVPTVAS